MNAIYLNGQIIDPKDATISPTDQGFLLGHGCFETIRVEQGKPFAFRYHYNRFSRSADRLKLTIPDQAELLSAIDRLLQKNETTEARVRITITGGNTPFPSESESPTLLITCADLPRYIEPATVVTIPYTRNETGGLAGIKSLSYSENVLAQQYARKHGADEAIFGNTSGNLCEGSTTNLFLVTNDEIRTPPLDSGCLPGTTRQIVLEIAQKLSITIKETQIPLPQPTSEVVAAFLTSSLRGIQPITKWDNKILPTKHPQIEALRMQYLKHPFTD